MSITEADLQASVTSCITLTIFQVLMFRNYCVACMVTFHWYRTTIAWPHDGMMMSLLLCSACVTSQRPAECLYRVRPICTLCYPLVYNILVIITVVAKGNSRHDDVVTPVSQRNKTPIPGISGYLDALMGSNSSMSIGYNCYGDFNIHYISVYGSMQLHWVRKSYNNNTYSNNNNNNNHSFRIRSITYHA